MPIYIQLFSLGNEDSHRLRQYSDEIASGAATNRYMKQCKKIRWLSVITMSLIAPTSGSSEKATRDI